MSENRLYYGDNLQVLRDDIVDETIDLIYLDPPFNSNATYNVLFRAPSGEQSQAQIEAFEDTWHWTDHAERAFDEVMESGNTNAAEMLRAMRAFLKENDMMAYLTMMAVRLLELHRVLKPTGSLYLHCDPTASHYLKILLDAVFGARNFRNEIIWRRTGAHGRAKRRGPIHDTILFYTVSDKYTWNRTFEKYDPAYVEGFYKSEDEHGRYQLVTLDGPGTRTGSSGKPWRGVDPTTKGRHWELPPDRALPDWFTHPSGYAEMSVQDRLDVLEAAGLVVWPKRGKSPRYKRYLSVSEGNPVQDIISDIRPIGSHANERLGFPTQKPEALLERIVQASSNEGDWVLDPFCGCGTTIHAAQKLGRCWIGIDITHLAISLIERRINDAFPGVKYQVYGTPKDLDGAKALAAMNKHQFQWWAVSLVNAHPYGGKKKGADTGIDGVIYFKPDGKRTEKAIVSVKGGERMSVGMIRDLRAVMEREKAPIGVFITLANPTKQMVAEGASAGHYETEFGKYPRIQILTVADLFNQEKPQIPFIDPAMFKKAPRVDTARQERLL